METERICPNCHKPLPPNVPLGLCPECLIKSGFNTGTEPGAADPKSAGFVPPPVSEIAKLFPQLEVLEFIGKGGMGAVYKARQPSLDRFVALKILPPAAAGDPGFAERFNREARALARLNHPNIVAVHDFGQVGSLHYLLMEFVDGGNLRQVEGAGRLAPEQALAIVPQICEALQFAHNEGIVHRDIKPENILMDKKGRVKITDFGIAKILGLTVEKAPLTGARDIMGTPHYMAPEQVEKPRTVDHRADIYSLGVVFYEMLTGELPLGRFAPPSQKVQIDVRLDEVVLHALEKEPALRYQQVMQVKTAVENITTTPGGQSQASTAASSGGGASTVDGEAIAREILARDYTLNVESCLRRGWALVRSDFWPLVGMTALVLVLLSAVTSSGASRSKEGTSIDTSVLGLLLDGPLMGALFLHFLRKIRGETVKVENAFSGFSSLFIPLVLAGFVTAMLTGLGLICLIFPGIYLLVAWIFTLPLVVDQRLGFWSAMQLSRKIISKHWWRFCSFLLVLGVFNLAGLLLFCVGSFVTFTVSIAALMYAYQDIIHPQMKVAEPAAPTPVQPGSMTRSGVKIAWATVVFACVAAFILLILGTIGLLSQGPVGILGAFAAAALVLAVILSARKLPLPRPILATFLTVSMWAFLVSVFITFDMPDSYMSRVRIKLLTKAGEGSGTSASSSMSGAYDPFLIQTEFEVLQSEVILDKVIKNLSLDREWSQRYGQNKALKIPDTLAVLKSRLDFRPVRNTSLIDVRCYSEKPDEAARIANEIAQVYFNRNAQTNLIGSVSPDIGVEIIDHASPALKPVRPNKPLKLALGALWGVLLGAAAAAARASFQGRRKPWLPRGFLAPFALLFLLVFGAGAAITFLLPESFVSVARLRLPLRTARTQAETSTPGLTTTYNPYVIQTECEVIQSEVILAKVIEQLNLNEAWGKKYAGGHPLKTTETLSLLKSRIDLRPVRNASVVEIRAFGETSEEPARIANAIAETYLNRSQELEAASPRASASGLEIIDRARPGSRSVRPNKPLNLFLSALAGLLLGTVGGVLRVALKPVKEAR